MGTEVLYLNNRDKATRVSAAIANAGGFLNRGAKRRTDLFFLNQARRSPILLEVCFVDSSHDVRLYRENFEGVCRAIASAISGRVIVPTPNIPAPVPAPPVPVGGLTRAEFNELNARLQRLENIRVFNTIEEIPKWGRPTIQNLADNGHLMGTDSGLNLNEDMVRMLVIGERVSLANHEAGGGL